jgi:signal transduction histidine kinase
VDLVTGVVRAAIAIHAAFSVLFLAARMRRPQEPEFGVLAALCGAVAFLSAARAAESHGTSVSDVLAMSRLAYVALIAAFALLCHFAVEYSAVTARKRWLVTTYGIAVVYELLNARGLLHDVAAMASSSVPPRFAPIGALGLSVYAVGIGAAGVALALFARAYLSGRREALALVVGDTILIATLLNDAGFAAGLFATTYLSAVGFLGIVAGSVSMLLSRYVTAARESSKRGSELRTRTRELRKSMAELAAAQEELGRKEQLAVVGELAAVIAHEVRNPLAIIANAVAGLRKSTLTRDDQVTLLTILEEETTRLNRLVSDLLRYARPVNVQRQSISLRDLIERGLKIVENRKSLQVELKVDAPDLRLWGDANLLRQVFENLIDNACQAMHYGGLLTLRVRPMQHEGVDGLGVDIIDTGEGMDTIVRSRARDPFFTTRPSGTGLGLAIVDRIVDAHGGHLLIDSRAGEGTTATVFLPFGSQSEPPPPRSRAPGTRRSGSSPSVRPPPVSAPPAPQLEEDAKVGNES